MINSEVHFSYIRKLINSIVVKHKHIATLQILHIGFTLSSLEVVSYFTVYIGPRSILTLSGLRVILPYFLISVARGEDKVVAKIT
jgi:hypothetical protein